MTDEELIARFREQIEFAVIGDRVHVIVYCPNLRRLLALAEECLERRRKEAGRGDAE